MCRTPESAALVLLSVGVGYLPKRFDAASLGRECFRRALLLVLAMGLFLGDGAFGGTLTVTTIEDGGAGSLRDAVASAQAGDVIVFAFNVVGTINLGGQIVLAKNLTIQGPGADKLSINGGSRFRVFRVDPGATVEISGLTIEYGAPSDNGGGISCSNATLSLKKCVVRFCSGFSGGGIVVMAGDGVAALTMVDSTVYQNTAQGNGGGLCNLAFANGQSTVKISNSTFSDNAAASPDQFSFPDGGGILNQSNSGTAKIQIDHSTFADN